MTAPTEACPAWCAPARDCDGNHMDLTTPEVPMLDSYSEAPAGYAQAYPCQPITDGLSSRVTLFLDGHEIDVDMTPDSARALARSLLRAADALTYPTHAAEVPA